MVKSDIYEKLLKRGVEKVIQGNVNAACSFWFYQATLPKRIEKFKR